MMRAPASRPLPSRTGFTLVEMMFATAICTLIGLVCMTGIVEGMHLFQSNSTEMIARDQGSRAIRRISTDVQTANAVEIYPNYLATTGSATTYGSCAVITNTAGTLAAYYFYAATSDTNSGGIYYCANASAAPNPIQDQLIVSSVQDFEFRADVNGSIGTTFKIGVYGYPTLLTGSKESDLVRFTTSNTLRN